MGKKMKDLRSTNWLLQNHHSDVKYGTGNVVNNSVITVNGVRWELELLGHRFLSYTNVYYNTKHMKLIRY